MSTKPTPPKLNRADRRSLGLRNSFLGPGGKPATYMTHAPGWRDRALKKMIGGQMYRSKMKRLQHRMRARGEEGLI